MQWTYQEVKILLQWTQGFSMLIEKQILPIEKIKHFLKDNGRNLNDILGYDYYLSLTAT